MRPTPLAQTFFRGNHQDVLARTIDHPGYRIRTQDLPYLIGALTFLGRIEDAASLFQIRREEVTGEDLASSRFFLGLGECRHSRYERGVKYFIANLREFGRDGNPVSRFYTYQGIGFYRYLRSQFPLSLRAASLARNAALEAGFLYGRYLASDLTGHSLVQTGQIAQGLKHLRDAIRLVKELGDGGMAESAKVALSVYNAQFGLDPKHDIDHLNKLCKTLPDENTYSRASILLELGRQYRLRGELKASQDVLNEACRQIHASRHRRQGAILNIRYASNLHLLGEPHQALNLVRNAFIEIDPKVDRTIRLQALGLEATIRKSLGFSDGLEPLESEIEKLTRYTGLGQARRILGRHSKSPLVSPPGEDPLGDLMDAVRHKTQDALEKIFDSGYLGALHEYLPIPAGKSALFVDLLPGSLLVANRGNLHFVPSGVTSHVRSCLKELARSTETCPKSRLIERVWGYEYHPLRHDPLIYAMVSKLRQLLGSASHWLNSGEDGYQLDPEVEVRFFSDPEPSPRPAREVPNADTCLNFRQVTFLRSLQKGVFLDVQFYRRKFKVSQITASRDLNELVAKGLLQRTGKARATRYVLN